MRARGADNRTVLVILYITQRTHCFARLRRSVDGISRNVLTNTLRGLVIGHCQWAEDDMEWGQIAPAACAHAARRTGPDHNGWPLAGTSVSSAISDNAVGG